MAGIDEFIDFVEKEIYFSEKKIHALTDFKKELDWDSMNAFLFMAMIQDKYGVILEDQDFVKADSIGDIFEIILHKIKEINL